MGNPFDQEGKVCASPVVAPQSKRAAVAALSSNGVFRKVCVIGLSNFWLYTMVEAVLNFCAA